MTAMSDRPTQSAALFYGCRHQSRQDLFFGAEYAVHPKWSAPQRWYIRCFGVVDLPSRLRARVVLREIGTLCGDTFLDIGSGTGNLSFYLSRPDSNVVWAVDIDAQRVRDCNHVAALVSRENVHFCLPSGNGGFNAFETETFDIVLAVEVLQYLADITVSLKEMLRMLKPGGFLVGHVPALGSLRPFERNLFNDQNIPDLLRDAGFEVVSFVPTFGKNILRLCRVFEWAGHHRILVALIFPILLAVSRLFSIQSPGGDYRLFVARKPLSQPS
jgi:SAM-dependent methyltransferase